MPLGSLGPGLRDPDGLPVRPSYPGTLHGDNRDIIRILPFAFSGLAQ